jgi:hypothetical protein
MNKAIFWVVAPYILVYTNVSEVPSASIIRAIFGPDDEGNKHL